MFLTGFISAELKTFLLKTIQKDSNKAQSLPTFSIAWIFSAGENYSFLSKERP